MESALNLEVFHRWIAAHGRHDTQSLGGLVSPDVVLVSGADIDHPRASGKQEAILFWRQLFASFPDMKMEVLRIVVDGDTLVAEIAHSGTMKGSVGAAEPTGRHYKTTGAFVFDFGDGKIRRIASYWDTDSMLRQLGVPRD